MTNTPGEIMQALLCSSVPGASQRFGAPLSPGAFIPLYVSEMPDIQGQTPNTAGAVYDTAGRVVTRLLASGKTLAAFGLQLKTRSNSYDTAYEALSATASFFDSLKRQSVTIGSNSYPIDGVSQTSTVISAGQDEKRRSVCTLNVLLWLLNN
jgi:hypothetical protein